MTELPAPPSTLPYPPIHTDKKYIALSDWFGRIPQSVLQFLLTHQTPQGWHDHHIWFKWLYVCEVETLYFIDRISKSKSKSKTVLTDNYGFGKDRRRLGNLEILASRDTFRYRYNGSSWIRRPYILSILGMDFTKCWLVSSLMAIHLKNVKRSYELVRIHFYITLLYRAKSQRSNIFPTPWVDIKLDPGFKEFYTWCKSNDIPVIIVSRRVHDTHFLSQSCNEKKKNSVKKKTVAWPHSFALFFQTC